MMELSCFFYDLKNSLLKKPEKEMVARLGLEPRASAV